MRVLMCAGTILGLLSLSGCGERAVGELSEMRAQLQRCGTGVQYAKSFSCEGGAADAGEWRFRIFPESGRVLVRVVRQEAANPSIELFQLSDCVIWDAGNWRCDPTRAGVGVWYRATNYEFEYSIWSTYGPSSHRIGRLQHTSALTTGWWRQRLGG